MSDPKLTEDLPTLTPVTYWQENLEAWKDLSESTRTIWVEQASRLIGQKTSETDAAETLTSGILRAMSDFNLRHWQNTARALDAMPSWMTSPKIVDGASITDWFDRFQRGEKASPSVETPKPKTKKRRVQVSKTPAIPMKPDDLTRIKGIGPKLSKQLNQLGVYSFKQIAAWTKTEASQIDDNLDFKGRVDPQNWASQARKLISNGSAHLH
ncbi:MAG: hypothetical protein Hens3KO_16210 [Henriciella sp.]